MKTSRLLVSLAVLAFLAPLASAQSRAEIDQGFMNGQMVVKFQEWMPFGDQRRVLAENGFKILHHYPRIQAFFVSFDARRDVLVEVRRFQRMKDVLWAQPNNLGRRTQSFPGDPNFGNSYALHNTGQTISSSPGTNDADMDCPEAWDLITDASSVAIAVVDSGMRMTHQDLASNLWVNPGEVPGNGIDDDGNGRVDDINGWDFLNNDNNPNDQDGHGTNVSGCIGMRGGNGVGSAGVCWIASMMILKDGDAIPQVALSAAAIEYAAMNGAVVCNFSTGYGGGNYPVLQSAVNVAQTAGMIICVAAGNSGNNLNVSNNAPATYTNDNLLVVAATDNDDDLVSWSNRGSTHVDVAAAGLNVYTTSRLNNQSYSFASGTSFSAPLTTGCVGLIRAYNPTATYQTVRSAVINTCDPDNSLNGQVASNGRVNLFAALNSVGPGGGPSAPNPDPMTFATAPFASSGNAITMVATSATPGPVEYYFTLESSTGTGGNDSGWITSATYVDSGLQAGAAYSYSVKARDASSLLETQPSMISTAGTAALAPGDVVMAVVKNTTATVSHIEANGNAPSTEAAIRFGFLYVGPTGSLQAIPHWMPLSGWSNFIVRGLTPTFSYVVNAITRDAQGSVAPSGPTSIITTPLLPPSAEGVVADWLGPAEQVMTVDGSNGGPDRVIQLSIGSSYTFEVANPSTMPIPANFAVVAWFGVPSDVYELAIPAPFGRGTLCFVPCDVDPTLPTFNLVSTFGSTCGEYTSTGGQLATWSQFNPGLPFALPELTLQAFIEETPGNYAVGNAFVFRYN